MQDTYNIPEDYINKIKESYAFIAVIKTLLDKQFPSGWTYTGGKTDSGREIIAVNGTAGWNNCLDASLRACNMSDIADYYAELEWDESDLFDFEIEKILMGTTDKDYEGLAYILA